MKHIITLVALVFATSCFGQETCNNVFDYNDNNTVDIEDFLAILGLFADVDLDDDGIWDTQDNCIDLEACNYAANPTEPCASIDVLGECGGGCEGDSDGDGVCDDVDTCVGELDECGVCNGPGPTEVVIEDIVITYDSVFLPVEDEWFVFILDADTTFSYTCAPECILNGAFSTTLSGTQASLPYTFEVSGNPVANVMDITLDFTGNNNGSWAADMAITVTSPDNQCVVFGGYDWTPGCDINVGNYNIVWSDGWTDALNGTYTASVDMSSAGLTGAGTWSVTAYNGWASGGEVTYDLSFTLNFCPDLTCTSPVSHDGYNYTTVLIGDQCWFAENLRSELYLNGDSIPKGLSDSEWQNTSSGAVAVYGEGSSDCDDYSPDGDACDEVWSLNEYGRLYNWHAVDDARGLCPSGWHVPTDGEWTELTDHLGGASVAGEMMKSTYGWYGGANGTNSSGFSGLPGGPRDINGDFLDAGSYGSWWSSSPNSFTAWNRYLNINGDNVIRDDTNPQVGFSIRCIKDSE